MAIKRSDLKRVIKEIVDRKLREMTTFTTQNFEDDSYHWQYFHMNVNDLKKSELYDFATGNIDEDSMIKTRAFSSEVIKALHLLEANRQGLMRMVGVRSVGEFARNMIFCTKFVGFYHAEFGDSVIDFVAKDEDKNDNKIIRRNGLIKQQGYNRFIRLLVSHMNWQILSEINEHEGFKLLGSSVTLGTENDQDTWWAFYILFQPFGIKFPR